jgi:hypothetical protein
MKGCIYAKSHTSSQQMRGSVDIRQFAQLIFIYCRRSYVHALCYGKTLLIVNTFPVKIEVLVHFLAFISICFRVSFEVSRELTMAMKD